MIFSITAVLCWTGHSHLLSFWEIIMFAVHCTPPCALIWLCGGCESCHVSSLPCITPWWFHRTSFLGHDLLPSGCSPSVFVESYEGGRPPEGFHSSFRQVHVEYSVKRGEERICTVQWLNSQDTNMLQAYVRPNPGFELTRYLLLCNTAVT